MWPLMIVENHGKRRLWVESQNEMSFEAIPDFRFSRKDPSSKDKSNWSVHAASKKTDQLPPYHDFQGGPASVNTGNIFLLVMSSIRQIATG